ncbi:MAG: sulfite exporter TauE/SafE family protein [Planctomycetes bacterium]|nr:sulfite exporter TauE/SafE family protein [Planctomycetota bacterium]
MPPATLLAIYGSLFVAGLASSMHCVGMCGPILAGFSVAFQRAKLTVGGREISAAPPRFPLWLDFTAYHAGRIWTYAMLGLGAGWLGQSIRDGSAYLGWQRPASIAIAAVVVTTGLLMLGLVPLPRWTRVAGNCGSLANLPLLAPLLQGRGFIPRLLLGAVMGLLPCGLVYAMLAVVATLPHPLLSGVGMVIFGLGTLPALTAVLLAVRIIPPSARLLGTRAAAVVIVAVGALMLGRAVWVTPDAGCPACDTKHDTAQISFP